MTIRYPDRQTGDQGEYRGYFERAQSAVDLTVMGGVVTLCLIRGGVEVWEATVTDVDATGHARYEPTAAQVATAGEGELRWQYLYPDGLTYLRPAHASERVHAWPTLDGARRQYSTRHAGAMGPLLTRLDDEDGNALVLTLSGAATTIRIVEVVSGTVVVADAPATAFDAQGNADWTPPAVTTLAPAVATEYVVAWQHVTPTGKVYRPSPYALRVEPWPC